MQFINGGVRYDTAHEKASLEFEAPYPILRGANLVGRIYRAKASNRLFMTVHNGKHPDAEDFHSAVREDITDFLDASNAPAEVYDKMGFQLEEA